YWRTPGTNRRPESLIRRTGSAGRVCFENIIMPKECVGFGGRVAGTLIRQSFKNTWLRQSRRKISAAWAKYSITFSLMPDQKKRFRIFATSRIGDPAENRL